MPNRHLASLLCLPFLAACAMTQPAENATGPEIFDTVNCTHCHGDDLEGGFLGPSLKEVPAHWNQSDLASFIAAPENFIEADTRLEALEDDYWFDMPTYEELSLRHRETVAHWLLEQPTPPKAQSSAAR